MALVSYPLPPSDGRPRILGDALFLGRETLLACRHRRGYDWEMEAPTLSGLCALLS